MNEKHTDFQIRKNERTFHALLTILLNHRSSRRMQLFRDSVGLMDTALDALMEKNSHLTCSTSKQHFYLV